MTTRQKTTAKGQLELRAQAAWLMNQPPQGKNESVRVTYTWETGGRQYVVLDGVTRRLAVYRVRAYDGFLRLLKRWPAGLPVFDPRRPQKPTQTFFEDASPLVDESLPDIDDPFAEEPSAKADESESAAFPPWRDPAVPGPAYVPVDRQLI